MTKGEKWSEPPRQCSGGSIYNVLANQAGDFIGGDPLRMWSNSGPDMPGITWTTVRVPVAPQGCYSEVQEIDWVGCIASLSPTRKLRHPKVEKTFPRKFDCGQRKRSYCPAHENCKLNYKLKL